MAADRPLAGFRRLSVFSSRADADEALSYLRARGIPSEELTILADNPPPGSGRGRNAFRHARSGAVLGALFGSVFWIFDLLQPVVAGRTLLLYLVAIGAVVGGLVGAALPLPHPGRRDHHQLLAGERVAERARSVLEERSSRADGGV